MDIKKIIGINLKYIRYQSGLSQEKFYEKYGLSVKYLSAVERGEKDIGVDLLQALSKVFHVSLQEFVTFDEKKLITQKRIDEKKKN